MSEDVLTQLQKIDVVSLTDVVRQDQRSPAFELVDWSVKRLSDKGIISPDGLWLFSGLGRSGTERKPWSVVLKIFKKPQQEPPPDDLWYWKRELLFAQSTLLEQMPGPLRAPRFYRIDEQPAGAWLWMEHIQEQRVKPWEIEDYAFAAHQLGCWNGTCFQKPLPAEPWLARRHYISWLSWLDVEKDWLFPLNQSHVSAELRRQYDQLWAERDVFYRVLETLPQAFSHFDTSRRNLFIRKNHTEQDELVAIDWALCGSGPLGAELNGIVADNGFMLEWPSAELTQLEASVYPNYIQGLHEAGWSGNVDLVRLGYVAWKAVYYGLIFPAATAVWCSSANRAAALQAFGLAEEDLFWKFVPLLEFALKGAAEARQLMQKTGMI